MKIKNFTLLVFLIISLPIKAEEIEDTSLVSMLQQGGYVLYLRHGATVHTQADADLTDLRNCPTQRNLSEQGKNESRMLGQAFKQLNIKVSKVFSSPYCRCVDTALYAFDKVEIDEQLRSTSNENTTSTSQLMAHLEMYLKQIPPDNTNTVLVSHTANLREVTKIWPKPEGVIHIFKPTGTSYEHIGHITPSRWSQLLPKE